MLSDLLAFNANTVLRSLRLLWQGLLAIVIVIGVIMLITYLMQYISGRITKNKEKSGTADKTPPDGDKKERDDL